MNGMTFVGAGALGTSFATMLASTLPITLYTRPSTAEKFARAGVIRILRGNAAVEREVGTGSGKVRVTADAGSVDADDAVVFTTKGRELAGAVAEFRARWNPDAGFVAGLQNGVMKDDVLAEAFGPERVIGAATVLGARRGDGVDAMVTGLGQTYLGEFDGSTSRRLEAMRAALDEAGLPVRADLDIGRLLWTKCVNALGAFGVGSLTQLPSTTMMQSDQLVELYLDILAEGAAVAAAEGRPVADFPDLPIAHYLTAPRPEIVAQITTAVRAAMRGQGAVAAYSSMTQDVMAGRPTEADSVFGDVVRRARRHDLAVPTLEIVRKVTAGLDELRMGAGEQAA